MRTPTNTNTTRPRRAPPATELGLALLLTACTATDAPSGAAVGAATAEEAGGHGHAGPHDSLDALGEAYREAIAATGREACTWQHESGTLRCPDGSRHDLRGMWAEVEAADDPAARAADLLAMVPRPVVPTDWATARPWVRLRVCTDPTPVAWPLHPAHPDGLHACLEAALPGGTTPVAPNHAMAWGQDRAGLLAAAGVNLARLDPRAFWPLSDHASRARVGDGHDADRLLHARAWADSGGLAHAATAALIVPDQALVVADPEGVADLDRFATTWAAEHPEAPAHRLVHDGQGWAPEQR